jgi:phage terminase Nu1 subunit (DNA packaging protein)
LGLSGHNHSKKGVNLALEEDIITAARLAQILGVNLRTVQRLTQESVLTSEVDPADNRKKIYHLAASVQAYIAHQVGKSKGNERSDRMAGLEEKKLAAEIALKESQGELHKMKTEIASGKYLLVEEVQVDYSRFFIILKKFVMSIPNRVIGMLAGHVDPITARGIEKDLANDLNDMLTAFVVAGQNGVKPK